MENESNTFQRKRLRNTIFILLFKLTHVISELTNFFFNLKYLLNPDTHYYSLQFYFMGQKLEKITESSIANSHFLINFFKKYFVFVLFLGTKFLDWYFQPANSNGQSNNTDNKIVGEPFKGMRNRTNFNYCSLCNKDFRNPTCLAVSGYVFCYTCIEEYVKRNGKCPITFVNCTLQSLHKIYKN